MTAVAVVDYGRGNVRSVANALEAVGAEAVITAEAAAIDGASRILLPGVGAFGDAMAALTARGLPDILRRQVLEKGKPFLGVCLGQQLLADTSCEHGDHAGLGWIGGAVVRLEPGPGALKIPHMGWNAVALRREHPLFAGIAPEHRVFYFVHSYHFRPADPGAVLATGDYGAEFAAAVARDNIAAVQFHPEKSQDSGLALLKNFLSWTP